MMVGRLLSFWDGIFSGAMLNLQGVYHKKVGRKTHNQHDRWPVQRLCINRNLRCQNLANFLRLSDHVFSGSVASLLFLGEWIFIPCHSFIHSFMWYNFTFHQTSSTGIWKNPTFWSAKKYKTLRFPLHIHHSLLLEPTHLQNNARQIESCPQHFALNKKSKYEWNHQPAAIVKSLSLDSRISPPLF